MDTSGSPGIYRVVKFPPERNATLDTLRWARKRLQVPSLIEVDVTDARRAIREYRNRTGKSLSLTAWVVACTARAALEHPGVHALRRGRHRIVLFHEVDVAVLVERSVDRDDGSQTLPMPMVVRNAHVKRPSEIHEEIKGAREAEVEPGSSSLEKTVSPKLQSLFFRTPWWLRDLVFWRWLLRSPLRMKKTMGTVVVTSTGMVVPGVLAWGIPLSLHPLAIGVGGIARRKWEGESREILALTVVFDHAVTDGAPVGRFIQRLHELLTQGKRVSEMEGNQPRDSASTLPREKG